MKKTIKKINNLVLNKSFLFFLFILSVSSIFCLMGGIGDSDPYWHTILGKYILEHKSIPSTDIFSWFSIERGFAQICHSWLGSIIIYLYTAIFKDTDAALNIFKFINLIIGSGIITLLFKNKSKNEKVSIFVVIPLIISVQMLIRCFINPRPLALGNILFIIALIVLDKINEDDTASKKFVYLLGIISLLIANVHGGALVMLVGITGIYFLAQYFPNFIRYIKRCINIKHLENKGNVFVTKTANTLRKIIKKIIIDIKHLPKMETAYEKTGMAIILEVLFGMINPYGPRIFFYAFFDEDSLAMSIINEWQPAKIFDVGNILSIIILLMISIEIGKFLSKRTVIHQKSFAGIKNNITLTIPHLLLLITFILFNGKYIRMSQYLFMILVLCSLDFYKKYNKVFLGFSLLQNALNVRLKQMALLSLSLLLIATGFITYSSYKYTCSDAPFKNGVVQFLKKNKYKRIYTSYEDGGFLIYHGMKSFIDSRSDPFPSKELVTATELTLLAPECYPTQQSVDNFLNKYKFDAILLYKTRDTPAIAYFEKSSNWKKVYEDVNKYHLDTDNNKNKEGNTAGFIVYEKK